MASVDEYRRELKALGLEKFTVTASNVAEAKAALADVRQKQKALRQIRARLNLDMKAIRAEYDQKKQNAGAGGSALIGMFGKRRAAGQYRATAKRQVTAERDRRLQPYETLKMSIDDLLLQMDRAKIQIQQYIDEAKAQSKQ